MHQSDILYQLVSSCDKVAPSVRLSVCLTFNRYLAQVEDAHHTAQVRTFTPRLLDATVHVEIYVTWIIHKSLLFHLYRTVLFRDRFVMMNKILC